MSQDLLRQMAESPAAFRRHLLFPTASGTRRLAEIVSPVQAADFAAIDPALVALADRSPADCIRRFWLERTKSYSKDHDAATSALWLLAFSTSKQVVQIAAVDADQAKLIRDAAVEILRANPILAAIITTNKWELVNSRTGSTLEILAHDIQGAHGGRPTALFLNELTHFVGREFFDVLLANVAKNPLALLCVLTNAGTVPSWQADLREQSIKSDRWYVNMVDTIAPWLDEADIAEQRLLLPTAVFDRLWGGKWTSGESPLFIPAEIAALQNVVHDDLSKPWPTPWTNIAGVDLGVTRDSSAVVVLGVKPGPRYRVQFAQRWTPTPGQRVQITDVENELLRLHHQYRLRLTNVDPWQAEFLKQRLSARGVNIAGVAFTVESCTRMANALLESVRQGQLEIPPQFGWLTDELLRVAIVDKGTSLRLDAQRNAQGHVDGAIALSLALLDAKRFINTGGSIMAPRMVGNIFHRAHPGPCWSDA